MMKRVRRRLGQLEDRTRAEREEYEETLRRKMLERMSDEELETYDTAVRRAIEAGEFAEEDRPILVRVDDLYEEVRIELEEQNRETRG
jgi:hypothetical protein